MYYLSDVRLPKDTIMTVARRVLVRRALKRCGVGNAYARFVAAALRGKVLPKGKKLGVRMTAVSKQWAALPAAKRAVYVRSAAAAAKKRAALRAQLQRTTAFGTFAAPMLKGAKDFRKASRAASVAWRKLGATKRTALARKAAAKNAAADRLLQKLAGKK